MAASIDKKISGRPLSGFFADAAPRISGEDVLEWMSGYPLHELVDSGCIYVRETALCKGRFSIERLCGSYIGGYPLHP